MWGSVSSHFDMWTGGVRDRTTNPLISGQPTVPSEPQPASVSTSTKTNKDTTHPFPVGRSQLANMLPLSLLETQF